MCLNLSPLLKFPFSHFFLWLTVTRCLMVRTERTLSMSKRYWFSYSTHNVKLTFFLFSSSYQKCWMAQWTVSRSVSLIWCITASFLKEFLNLHVWYKKISFAALNLNITVTFAQKWGLLAHLCSMYESVLVHHISSTVTPWP